MNHYLLAAAFLKAVEMQMPCADMIRASITSDVNMHCGKQKMLLQITTLHTRWGTSLLGRLSVGTCCSLIFGTEVSDLAKVHKAITVVSCFGNALLHLPADSPVLIQSGFAILAIAKISAARNRHPEMIVSLSISPADGAVHDVGKCGGRCPNERHRGGLLSV